MNSFPHKKQIKESSNAAHESLSLFRTGPHIYPDMVIGKINYGAKFDLGLDIRHLFPYINTVVKGAQYFGAPEYIKFVLDEHLCILYPDEGAFTPVENYGEAFDFMGVLLNYLDDIDLRRNEIEPNLRKYYPASPIDIYKLLPGTNCRDCDYNTCIAFAAALSRQHTSLEKCPHFTKPTEEKSTFNVVDKQGNKVQSISLPINTSCLQEKVRQKEAHIQTLQKQIASYEQNQNNNIIATDTTLLSPLTKREIEILKIAALGETNKEISKSLDISEHTVKTHIGHIFDKLGVNDRTQASVWAAQNGLL